MKSKLQELAKQYDKNGLTHIHQTLKSMRDHVNIAAVEQIKNLQNFDSDIAKLINIEDNKIREAALKKQNEELRLQNATIAKDLKERLDVVKNELKKVGLNTDDYI